MSDSAEVRGRADRAGASVRSDIVDVYIFRAARAGDSASVEFLQLRRAGPPMAETWQPVMGHMEAGETAAACTRRELAEEVGLRTGDPAWVGLWALEQVHPYYLPDDDCIMLSPRFAVQVAAGWAPELNSEHSAHRWVGAADIGRMFMWPGQKRSCEEILAEIVRPGSPAAERMRIDTRG